MIYTVTFSPAIDYVVELNNLNIGDINRTVREHYFPGGKGVNVSRVLSNLGRGSVATGFVAGFTGDYIIKELETHHISSRFIEVEGTTRINVKIKNNGEETAINGQGPNIDDRAIEQLIRMLERLGREDTLIISGTIPSTLPKNIYELILARVSDNDCKIIVDAEGEILLNCLKYHPFLIKPNKEELEKALNIKADSEEELVNGAKEMIKRGATNVIVSLGKDGALLIGKNIEPLFVKAPQGKVVHSVGAGDGLVAGFIDEYLESQDIIRAFKKGVATGSATAFSEGLARKEDAEALFAQME
ncbi:MAG: 1-phosphofructokinase [Erysipelotrichaceae bacterium]|nr:1-phosphofructokinase [Erysipelotrichaceae bacterium]